MSITAQVQPNPTRGNVHLILNTTESIKVNISLYHLTGQLVNTIFSDKQLYTGSYDLPINLEALPPGVYYLRVETEERKEVLPILKME